MPLLITPSKRFITQSSKSMDSCPKHTCAKRRTVTCDVCSECTYLICSCWSHVADLSKNRFTEIPPEVCLFAPLESLNLYHNCIKCIPEAIINLQMLTYLDIRWVTPNAVTFFWLLCVFLRLCVFNKRGRM